MPKDAATNHAADTPWQSTMTYAEFADLGRDSITAAIDSNAALSAGLEAIGQEVALYARDTFESVGETARGMLNARTFEDFVRLQTEFAKRNFYDVWLPNLAPSEPLLKRALSADDARAWASFKRAFAAEMKAP